jgi:hypothetical protein
LQLATCLSHAGGDGVIVTLTPGRTPGENIAKAVCGLPIGLGERVELDQSFREHGDYGFLGWRAG